MDSGICSINTSFLHGSYSSRHSFTKIFFCSRTEVLLSLQSLGSSMLRPGSVQSCQFSTLTFLHEGRKINGEVVIKYATTNKLGKRVVVRGMGTVCHEIDIFWRSFLFSVIGRCWPVSTPYWLRGKCGRINLSQAASGMILRNHRRLPERIFSVKIASLGSLKRGYWKDFQTQ
jgi:hypothetical protein